MGKEIERKFLVKPNVDFTAVADSSREIIQGYLSTDPRATLRVRISGEKAWLTIKGETQGIERSEWEYPIPLEDAKEMLRQCASKEMNIISKTRYECGPWEIDRYNDSLLGLVIAEIELDDPEAQVFLPEWIDREVSDDPRYFNSMLARFGKPD